MYDLEVLAKENIDGAVHGIRFYEITLVPPVTSVADARKSVASQAEKQIDHLREVGYRMSK